MHIDARGEPEATSTGEAPAAETPPAVETPGSETPPAEAPSAGDEAPDPGEARDPAEAPESGGALPAEAPAVGEPAPLVIDPVDPWQAFAPVPPVAPNRSARVRHRVGRILAHEWTVASVGALLLAVVMTWPTLRHPTNTIPQDIGDPTLQAWQIAWAGHALMHSPLDLWQANAFYPAKYSYAFSDTLLGYAPAGMIGTGPGAAVLRYNILFVLAAALAFVGAYALVRQLGASRFGASVAGAAFAYAPWRLAHGGHLNILSTGGIALSLAMLARGHGYSLRGGYRRDLVRPGWIVAGWAVAAWQVTLGFGIGLPFAYLMGVVWLVATIVGLVRGPRLKVPLVNLGGAVLFAAVAAFMSYPYLRVLAEYPDARRPPAETAMFSPPLRGFFIAPGESLIWGDLHAGVRQGLFWFPEMTLLPGFALLGFALAGLFFSIWTVRQRIVLAAGVVVSVVLGLGTSTPGGGKFTYLLLGKVLPGFDELRTSGRLVVWTTLLLGVLAAGVVSAFVQNGREAVTGDRVPGRPDAVLRWVALVPLALVLVEGLGTTAHPHVPTAPIAFAEAGSQPLLVLPTDATTDENVMLWTTDHFPEVVNGNSGFNPRELGDVRETMKSFPSEESVRRLRDLGVKTVVVLRDRAVGSPYAGALDGPVEGLDVERREVPGAVVYRLR
jgi:hypothetical protein